MIFSETKFKDVFLIKIDKRYDKRGFFARTWDKKKFKSMGLNSDLVQCNISFNEKIGTLRGMHYQTKPFEETKLVMCIKGKIYDVIIDLRKESKTYKKWISIILDSKKYELLYIPGGFAHGFQTLEENSEVFYQMSKEYNSKASKGIRWNDPIFSIIWPIEKKILSEKDSLFPDFID